MNEILREIEEDMRRERLRAAWNNAGKLMVAASIAVVLGTVGYVLWQDHREGRAIADTTQFIKGNNRINLEDYKGAITTFGELAEHSSSYHELALLRKAEAHRLNNDATAAVKTYEVLVEQKGAFAGLASVLAADHGGAQPIADASRNGIKDPFYYTLIERKAWNFLQEKKKEEALGQFTQLWEDSGTPRSMRERAHEVLQHIAPERLKDEKAHDESPDTAPAEQE